MILATSDLRDFTKIVFNYFGHGVVNIVASLAVGEECFGVLCRTACHGTLRRQGAVAETLDVGRVDELCHVFLLHDFNLVVFMRGTETVEEVYEGHAGLQCCQVGNGCQVHYFLYRSGAEHGKTRLTAGHHILVIAEDTKRMTGERTGRYVEYARKQFACNLIHIRNHEQQALRCGERGGQRTSLQRAVKCTGSAAFRLHFLNSYVLPPEVLATTGSPFIDVLRHGRRGRDGVDGGNFGEHIAHVSCCLVAVACDKLLFFCHFCYSLMFCINSFTTCKFTYFLRKGKSFA